MSGEDHAVFGQTSVLENFRRVTMRKEIVGFEIFVDLDEVEVATGGLLPAPLAPDLQSQTIPLPSAI